MFTHLYYFDPHEFVRGGISWMPQMDPRLLVLLDLLRDKWGKPIRISLSSGAVGRRDKSASWHNVARHGRCCAVDIVPEIETTAEAHAFFTLAKDLGFTGIGVYRDWESTRFGFHLDTRTDKWPGYPATWGRVDGDYVSLDEAMA